MLMMYFLYQEYKKDLEEDIRSDTSGDFRAALMALCKVGVLMEGVSTGTLFTAY